MTKYRFPVWALLRALVRDKPCILGVSREEFIKIKQALREDKYKILGVNE